MADISGALWQTSTYSQGGGTQCVEVAGNLPAILIRDSKRRSGGMHVVSRPAWAVFVDGIKQDQFD